MDDPAWNSRDPLDILRNRYWPTCPIPARPDGSLDVLAYGRMLDQIHNPLSPVGDLYPKETTNDA